MNSLTINDIKDWLIQNRVEYQKLKAQEYPPLNNEVYWMYNHLYEFIEYYPYTYKCNKSLKELKSFLNCDFPQIIKWTRTNEVLGSQQLLMFEVNYLDWTENIDEGILKIHKGLYTEKKPFADIICFCKIFQLLYWNNSVHETNLTEKEQLSIKKQVGHIFKKYYLDTDHD